MTGRIVFTLPTKSTSSNGAETGKTLPPDTDGDGDAGDSQIAKPRKSVFADFNVQYATPDILARIEKEEARLKARAAKFGVEYKPPSAREIVEADEDLWAQYTREFGKQKHRNPNLVEAMPAVKESDDVVEKRRARFGHVKPPAAAPTTSDLTPGPRDIKSRVKRAKRFGINVQEKLAKQNESQSLAARRQVADDELYRYDAIHVHGTDSMHTRDIFEYFQHNKPSHIEWINDSSLNVCWTTAEDAQAALKERTSEYAVDEVAAVENWRPGKSYKETNLSIWLRLATNKDVKVRDAWKHSLYYKKQNQRKDQQRVHDLTADVMRIPPGNSGGRAQPLSSRLTAAPLPTTSIYQGEPQEDSEDREDSRRRRRRGESDDEDEDDDDDYRLNERAKRSKVMANEDPTTDLRNPVAGRFERNQGELEGGEVDGDGTSNLDADVDADADADADADTDADADGTEGGGDDDGDNDGGDARFELLELGDDDDNDEFDDNEEATKEIQALLEDEE